MRSKIQRKLQIRCSGLSFCTQCMLNPLIKYLFLHIAALFCGARRCDGMEHVWAGGEKGAGREFPLLNRKFCPNRYPPDLLEKKIRPSHQIGIKSRSSVTPATCTPPCHASERGFLPYLKTHACWNIETRNNYFWHARAINVFYAERGKISTTLTRER